MSILWLVVEIVGYIALGLGGILGVSLLLDHSKYRCGLGFFINMFLTGIIAGLIQLEIVVVIIYAILDVLMHH